MRTLFIAGNWKMNLSKDESCKLGEQLRDAVGDAGDVRVAVCPPFVFLDPLGALLDGSPVAIGAQNMHPEIGGAFTGEVSGSMLKDVGCEYVIIGHSERRHVFGETEDFIAAKVTRALADGLKPIVCVGETLAQRESSETQQIVCRQVESALNGVDNDAMSLITIAYEPVWAIGTGRTAAPEQAEEVHAIIRSLISDLFDSGVADNVVIQYGGSVKPDNATDLLSRENVDGALVGGASLKAETFIPIIESARSIMQMGQQ